MTDAPVPSPTRRGPRRLAWLGAILAAAIVLVGSSLAVGLFLLIGTRTGRTWLRDQATRQVSAALGGRGRLEMATFGITWRGEIRATHVALLDSAGSPVVMLDSLEGRLQLRPLRNRVIHLARARLVGGTLTLRQDAVGRPWNLAFLLVGGPERGPAGPPGFGDEIRIDSLEVRELSITTRMPWVPHPVFRGAARDSVIAVRDSLHDLRQDASGAWFEHRAIRLTRVAAHAVTLVEPTGRLAGLRLDSLAGGLSDPAVVVGSANGRLAWTADSLHFALDRVRLPHSEGTTSGWVAWDQPGPVRFDARLIADAGLADLGWVWDALPFEGRGRAAVRLRTLEDPFDAEYRLDSLRLAVGASTLWGSLAVIVRPDALELRAVDLTAAAFTDALARRLSYGALPTTVRGTFDGHLESRSGGPLTAFPIDQLDLRFRDRAGGRAVLRMAGRMALGAEAGLYEALVDTVVIEAGALRRMLDGTTPLGPVDGVFSGRARIARADLRRVQIPSAQLVWTDGAGLQSRLTISGTVERPMAPRPLIEGTLSFAPLDLRALSRMDSTLTWTPRLVGTVSVHGAPDSLEWTAAVDAEPLRHGTGAHGPDLAAAFGRTGTRAPGLEATGSARRDGGRWQVTTEARLTDLDLQAWRGAPVLPMTAVSGRLALAVTLDSLRSPSGSLDLALEQLAADARPGILLSGRLTLDSTRVHVDSMVARSGGVALDIRGTVARRGDTSDTLIVSARTDDLAALRPELRRVAAAWLPIDSVLASQAAQWAADSLLGQGTIAGYLTGHLDSLNLTASLAARGVQAGRVQVDRVFGSLVATQLGSKTALQGTASVDGVRGLGNTQLQTATVHLTDATWLRGRFGLEVRGESALALDISGSYDRPDSGMVVRAGAVQLRYGDTEWGTTDALTVQRLAGGWRVPAFALRSSRGGLLSIEASVPAEGAVSGRLELQRFPLGEVGALLTGTPMIPALVSGAGSLGGTREAPRLEWNGTADSVHVAGIRLPALRTVGRYADGVASGRVDVRDSAGGAVTLDVSLPLDLRLADVPKRLLDDRIRGTLRADSLRLDQLDWRVEGVHSIMGQLTGALAVSGTVERPVAEGALRLDDGGATIEELGITPRNVSMRVRANADSLLLESLRLESGSARDTLGMHGVLHLHEGKPAELRLEVGARTLQVARRPDGTDVDLSGRIQLVGPLARPVLSGVVQIPRATLVIDPLAARTALDLTSETARALLGAGEMPVAGSGATGLAALGKRVQVDGLRVELANDVWVQTPEARVKLSGGLDVASARDRLTLAGEIRADRGQYRLDLGLVSRSFSVDSGRVRFFAEPTLPTTLDIRATNVVRDAGGTEIPVGVHIGGSYERPVLTLSSRDPLYASAPESEIISLLLFGAPTFALDGQRQNTVQAVTGVLLPSVGGAVEGALQRLLPVFNTVQVTTAGRQGSADLTAFSLLDNLSISAGKQLGERTFLRLNTGVCRGAGQATIRGASLWYGVAAEHRLAPHLVGQVGVDPGAAPCARLGADVLPRLQFGFDLFREWIW